MQDNLIPRRTVISPTRGGGGVRGQRRRGKRGGVALRLLYLIFPHTSSVRKV